MQTLKDFVNDPKNVLWESHKHLLPKCGDFPYVPPKKCHHGAHRIKGAGKEVYADTNNLHWSFNMLHKSHWDVRNPNGKAKNAYIRVDPSGSIFKVRARSMPEGQQLLLECGITPTTPVQLILT